MTEKPTNKTTHDATQPAQESTPDPAIALPLRHMTAKQYLAWAKEKAPPELHTELVKGRVVAMGEESRRHSRIKGALYRELQNAIEATDDAPCEALVDGPHINTASDTLRRPDVLVTCEDDDEGPLALNPVLVCEVLSPSTARIDLGHKLKEYFDVPSVQAYLIIDPVSHAVSLYAPSPKDIHGRGTPAAMVRLDEHDTFELENPPITVNLVNVFAGQTPVQEDA